MCVCVLGSDIIKDFLNVWLKHCLYVIVALKSCCIKHVLKEICIIKLLSILTCFKSRHVTATECYQKQSATSLNLFKAILWNSKL